MKCFLPRGKDCACFFKFHRLNATPDIRVIVRRVIVAIPIPKPSIVVVVPITASVEDTGIAHTTLFYTDTPIIEQPIRRLPPYIKGEVSPLIIPLLKRCVAKATPDTRVTERRVIAAIPTPKPSIAEDAPMTASAEDSTAVRNAIIGIVPTIVRIFG